VHVHSDKQCFNHVVVCVMYVKQFASEEWREVSFSGLTVCVIEMSKGFENSYDRATDFACCLTAR